MTGSPDGRPAPGSAGAWLLAIRPHTLPASVGPVLLGWSLASATAQTSAVLGLACVVVALSLQTAANLANDVFDARTGVDGDDRLGPLRVTQSGLLRPGQVLAGLALSLVVGMAAGVYAAAVVGWWLLGLGLLCLIAAVAYTAGPLPLARHGLGEAAALLFFGPVACTGTFVVLNGTPTSAAWVAGFIPGFHAAAIMAVNNLRDRVSDAAAGKVTLAVRLSERGARFLPAMAIIAGNLVCIPLAIVLRTPAVLGALVLLPMSVPLLHRVMHEPISRDINRVLAMTGRWELVTCLLVAGLVWI